MALNIIWTGFQCTAHPTNQILCSAAKNVELCKPKATHKFSFCGWEMTGFYPDSATVFLMDNVSNETDITQSPE